MTVVTRFAPSPTGDLHIGSVRTALFSWLFAKHHGGQFLLRVEDTDIARSTQQSIDVILQGLAWMGITPDEAPVYQSERRARHQAIIAQLLASGHAYCCNCTKARLEQCRNEQIKKHEKPRYDGFCRDRAVPASGDYVVRFKTPQQGTVTFADVVHGPISVSNSELDDLIIARQDGSPTYNLSVVVDDMDMGITHIIRGDDHINNTPRQIHLLQAMAATLPVYAHVPMILGDDGKRLSKRHGAVSVLQYQKDGFLSEALRNYLLRLGWSHGDQEIFSEQEMIEHFTLSGLNKSAASLNTDKLLWMNQQYFNLLDCNDIARRLAPFLNFDDDTQVKQGPPLHDVVLAQRQRVKTLTEMAEKSQFWYDDAIKMDANAAKKHLRGAIRPALLDVSNRLNALSAWNSETIDQALAETLDHFEIKLGKLAQPIRVAVTGTAQSPPIDITLTLLGQSRTMARLQKALEYIDARNSSPTINKELDSK